MPGSVFDREFRCTFELLQSIPSASDSSVSVTDAFFAFNDQNPFNDRAHILDRNVNIVHGPRFGLTLADAFALTRVSLTPEPRLDGRRIKEFFAAPLLRHRILAALVDDNGLAAPAQRDRVPPLHEPLPGPVPRPVNDAACFAHARQSTPGLHRTPSGLAARPLCHHPDRSLRP